MKWVHEVRKKWANRHAWYWVATNFPFDYFSSWRVFEVPNKVKHNNTRYACVNSPNGRSRVQISESRARQHSTFSNGRIIQIENNQRNIRSAFKCTHDQMDNRHSQNVTSNSCRLHILLISTWNILQDRSFVRPQKS